MDSTDTSRAARFGICGSPWTSAALAFVLLLCGCGTGEYNDRLQGSLNNVGRRASIEAYLQPTATDVGNTGVRFRLPTTFDSNSRQLAAADPRAKIAGVELPGFVKGIERGLDDAAGKFAPAFVYLAAVPKEGKKLEELQADLLKAIAPVVPGVKWEPAAIPTLAGSSVNYNVLKGNAPQEFDGTQSGGAVEQLDGQLELYIVPADKHWVLVGWRAPKAQADKYKLFEAAKAAMGSVEVAAGAAPAPAAAPAEGGAPAAAS